MESEPKPIQVFDLRDGRFYKIPLERGDVVMRASKVKGRFRMEVVEAPPGVCMEAIRANPSQE